VSQVAPPVTVAGAGNWLLGHDRIGPLVLDRLSRRLPEDVELADLGCSGLALLDRLRGQDLLVVVDACVGRGRPGEVMVVEPDLDRLGDGWPSAHQIGPVETLAVGRALYPELEPKRVVLVLVETTDLEESNEDRACAAAVRAVEREVETWRRSRPAASGGDHALEP
jgi:hydrogenase maturation protease